MLFINLLGEPIAFIAVILGLIIGITVHEYAHAYIAYKCGDYTAKYEGRLSLNPLVHLDPLGTLFLFVVGFGWGKPVPINPSFFSKKSDELKVAIAGIVANIIIALILAIPLRVATAMGIFIDRSIPLQILNLVVELNLILAAFNLIPIPPLDGSHFVEYFLSEQGKATFQRIGPFVLIGVLLYGSISGHSVIYQFIEPVVRFLSFVVKGMPSSIF